MLWDWKQKFEGPPTVNVFFLKYLVFDPWSFCLFFFNSLIKCLYLKELPNLALFGNVIYSAMEKRLRTALPVFSSFRKHSTVKVSGMEEIDLLTDCKGNVFQQSLQQFFLFCDFVFMWFFLSIIFSWQVLELNGLYMYSFSLPFFCYVSLLLLHHSKFFSVIAWLDYYLTFSPWYWTIIMGLHSGSLFRHFSLDRHFVLFLFLLFILTFLSRRFWNPSKSLKKVTSRKKLIVVTLCCKMMMLKATNSDGWK